MFNGKSKQNLVNQRKRLTSKFNNQKQSFESNNKPDLNYLLIHFPVKFDEEIELNRLLCQRYL